MSTVASRPASESGGRQQNRPGSDAGKLPARDSQLAAPDSLLPTPGSRIAFHHRCSSVLPFPAPPVLTIESVRADLAVRAPDLQVLEATVSTATVALAAEAWQVAPGQIAKTLSLRVGDRVLLVVASGDHRLDNRKLRAAFGGKAKMLGAQEVADLTGHPVGGVCPFGLAAPLPIYCDESLRLFDEVVPAAGSINSALKIATVRLAELCGNQWVDVCEPPKA